MTTMAYGTLAIVNAPTLSDGLVELLRIGDALELAGQDCGVQLYRDPDGPLVEAEPDYDLPHGVIATAERIPVDPWTEDHWTGSAEEQTAAFRESEDRRRLLELLASLTDADLLATSDRVEWL